MNHHHLVNELDPLIERTIDWITELRTLTSDEWLIAAFVSSNCDALATLATSIAVFEGDALREKAADGKIRPTPVPIGGRMKSPLYQRGL
jgi:hypothetical protein